jgi:hypothetical protein
VREVGSVTGEIRLLWRQRDRYRGEVLLLTLEPEDPGAQSTFELFGPLAGRVGAEVAEGLRVRVVLQDETVELVNQETGETGDALRASVVDVVVLPP